MPKLGAYSKEIVLARPDRRSREARLLKQVRRELTRQLGGKDALTPALAMVIESIAMMRLRLAKLDEKVLDGSFTAYDAKVYNACSNSLARQLKLLGLEPAAPQGRTLADLRREAQREAVA